MARGRLKSWPAALVTLLVLAAPPVVRGGEGPRWLGGQIYEENDSIVFGDGDQRYTQGFRISINRSPARPLCFKANATACVLPAVKKALGGWLLSHDTS